MDFCVPTTKWARQSARVPDRGRECNILVRLPYFSTSPMPCIGTAITRHTMNEGEFAGPLV